jgi:hypothetical protein
MKNINLALKIRADLKKAYTELGRLTRGFGEVDGAVTKTQRGLESISDQLSQLQRYLPFSFMKPTSRQGTEQQGGLLRLWQAIAKAEQARRPRTASFQGQTLSDRPAFWAAGSL